MLAQRVPQLHCDYLPATHLSATSDSKTSPLALLAATCSSIGRNDVDKPKEPSFTAASTASLMMAQKEEEHLKSSFKPYRTDSTSTVLRSPPSAAPTKSSPSCSRVNPPPMFLSRMQPPPLPPLDSEKLRTCASTFLDTSDSAVLSPVVKCHSASVPPIPTAKPPLAIHGCHDFECTNCASSLSRSHIDPLPMLRRSSPPSSCPCSLCSQNRILSEQTKCHYQSTPLYPAFKTLPSSIVCRDPSCTSCTKFPHGTLQNFLHPALIHQCTHGSYPPLPPPHGSLDYTKGSVASKGFVCNWMAEGKHCGKNFASSEELFQHLKSHTSAQQVIQNCDSHLAMPMPPPPPSQLPSSVCNILGCPCKSGPVKSRTGLVAFPYGSGTRYSPYSRGLASVPGGTPTFQGHSYAPHGAFHY